jgi:ceramide glucosyltransferase
MIAVWQGLSLLLIAMAVAGCLFQVASAVLVRRFRAAPRPAAAARPPISVMKPLCGAEPGMAENLDSCLRQDYPAFQMVFGVADAADPALRVVDALPRDLAGVEVEAVADPTRHGLNLKVGNLLNMWPRVRHDLIAIADSDIRVDDRYLDDLAAPFADPGVGVVTCLYVGRPVPGLCSALGAMGINHGFLPGAVLARAIGRRDGCFGATMAVRREVLEKGGGLAALSRVLADDWVLGKMARDQGLDIALAARPVDITVHEPDLKTLLDHEIRWGRTIAAVDRASYMASVITQPVALALLAVAAGGGWTPSLAALALAWGCRLWAVRVEERALGLPRSGAGLVALREILSFVVYVVACGGRTVVWRGRRFAVRADGTLDQVEGSQT